MKTLKIYVKNAKSGMNINDKVLEKMENETLDHVLCPLVNRMIEDIECIVNRDVVDRLLKESCIPAEFKIDNFREICKECKYHDY